MAEVSDIWGAMYQNLVDAGCDSNTANRCVSMAKQQKSSELLKLLFHHRLDLINTLHEQQQKIDCLDFLLYKLQQNDKKKE